MSLFVGRPQSKANFSNLQVLLAKATVRRFRWIRTDSGSFGHWCPNDHGGERSLSKHVQASSCRQRDAEQHETVVAWEHEGVMIGSAHGVEAPLLGRLEEQGLMTLLLGDVAARARRSCF